MGLLLLVNCTPQNLGGLGLPYPLSRSWGWILVLPQQIPLQLLREKANDENWGQVWKVRVLSDTWSGQVNLFLLIKCTSWACLKIDWCSEIQCSFVSFKKKNVQWFLSLRCFFGDGFALIFRHSFVIRRGARFSWDRFEPSYSGMLFTVGWLEIITWKIVVSPNH